MADDTLSPSRTRLPARRAFVVHLLEVDDSDPCPIIGRVEHVISGHAARFEDVASLIEFFRHMLTEPSGREP